MANSQWMWRIREKFFSTWCCVDEHLSGTDVSYAREARSCLRSLTGVLLGRQTETESAGLNTCGDFFFIRPDFEKFALEHAAARQ